MLLVLREPYIDLGVKVNGFLVESHDNFLRTIERHLLTLCTRSYLSDIVKTEHHIL